MMRIEAVDFFYVAMPEVTDEGDGSQDALLVRVAAGSHIGWGECEASPLVSIAAFVTPKSHGACRPVAESVLGARLDGPDDIMRLADRVAWNSMDLLQAQHTWSGIEIALWDLLGRARGEPVWRLLGFEAAHPKRPYASLLFADEPEATRLACRTAVSRGFTAVKLGWGPFGRHGVAADRDQLAAAREGLGPEATLLVDAGQIFGEDVEAAAARLPALAEFGATWLEEPFHGSAFAAAAALAARPGAIPLAGGEAAHNRHMAENAIRYGGLSFVQIDCGRIGGIGPAHAVARFAAARGVTYVNHTFTSHLALAASLQPYAGLRDHEICEYPADPKPLAREITRNHLEPRDGLIALPDAPGLGIEPDPAAIGRYLVEVEIRAGGRILFASRKP